MNTKLLPAKSLNAAITLGHTVHKHMNDEAKSNLTNLQVACVIAHLWAQGYDIVRPEDKVPA